jgi:hypothetical protein
MAISGGIRLNHINRENVAKVGYSDKGNLILRYNGETDWKFVLDEKGQKIPQTQIHELRKAIANPVAIDWLISQIGKK